MINIPELLYDVVGRIDDAVYVKDPAGVYLYVNQRAARLLGRPVEQIIGATDAEVFAPEHVPELEALDRKVREGRQAFYAETRYRTRRGVRRYATRLYPVVSEGGHYEGLVGIARDITDLRDAYDPLTGLNNRQGLMRAIDRRQRERATARDQQPNHLLCLIDLQDFEMVNEVCGHAAGDALLVNVARIIERHARPGDLGARLNSDEFALLMGQREVDEATPVIESLIEQITSARASRETKSMSVGVSVGVSVIDDGDDSPGQIISMAKQAATSARERGRNRFSIYDEADSTIRTRRAEIVALTQFDQALEEDGFELYAQKICPLNGTGGLPSYEVLVRMHSGDGDLLRPGNFLPVVEKSSRAMELDHWVIDRAFQWIASHRDSLDKVDYFAINVSGQSLGDAQLLRTISRCFADHAVPHEKICFEITETAAIQELANAVLFIKHLRQLGCRVALDDFGAGLSSFRYLRDLPVDYVKIDGTFVRNICANKSDYIVTRGMHGLTRDMGIRSVAEFIENAQIERTLREIGVDFGQGLYIHSPEPLSKIRGLH